MRRREPKTPAEWQEAVDLAAGSRMIHDCKLYGLIVGGPDVDAARCDYILENGAKLGYRPSRTVAEIAIDLIEGHRAQSAGAMRGKP